MDLIKWIANLGCVVLGVFWTLLLSLFTLVAVSFDTRFGPRCMRTWGKGWLWLMGIQVKTLGLELLPRGQACVLAPNHQSGFDIFVLSALPIDVRWVSKAEIGKIPFLGKAMRAIGCYFVQRNRSAHDLNVMKEVEDGLKRGHSIVIFPEGIRTRSGQLLPFKKGAFRTAQNAGVPLVPVGIHGTFQIAPPGTIPRRRGHQVTVRFGAPRRIEPHEDIGRVMNEVRNQIHSMIVP